MRINNMYDILHFVSNVPNTDYTASYCGSTILFLSGCNIRVDCNNVC